MVELPYLYKKMLERIRNTDLKEQNKKDLAKEISARYRLTDTDVKTVIEELVEKGVLDSIRRKIRLR